MDWLERLAEAYACQARGDAAGAEALAGAVLGEQPEQPMALHLLGVLALRDGRAGEALSLLTRAVALRPDNNDTVLAHADALAGNGDPAAAVAGYRRVLAAQPHRPDALVNCARAQHRLLHYAEAEADARAAIAASPDLAAAHATLGSALLQQKRLAEALTASDAALALDPALAEAWFARGTALSGQHRHDEAVAALERAVQLQPQDASAWLNLGNAQGCCDAADAAEAHVRRALRLDPGLAAAHASLGWLLTRAGRLDAAVAACDFAVRLRPNFAEGHWNRATAHLLAGDFARGWDDYEWRRHPDLFGDTCPRLPGPEWDGGDLAGRHLLVLASQGMGDIIQTARFLPALAERAARVTLACPRPLLRLLQQLPVAVVASDTPLPDADVWIDQMSLPHRLGIRLDTIPRAAGYLAARTGQATPSAEPRVGIAWAGNPAHPGDQRRSLPLESLRPLLATPHIRFASLQVGRDAARIEAFGLPDASPHLPDFFATARLIDQLDLVICVDTAVAHLAGALGKPVWIMLPYAPDWRWLLGRDDSPWYCSARLFRQHAPGDWAGVVTRIVETLAAAPALAAVAAHAA